jgi:hypothetical protein
MTRRKTKPEPQFRTRCENYRGEPFHYFASSLASWRTGTDLDKLIADMKRENFPFNVYRVELPETAAYAINYYTPQVDPEQLHHVGFWEVVPEGEPT